MRMNAARLALACVVCACAAPAQSGPAPRSTNPQQFPGALRIDTVAVGLDHPWGIAFLPDGRILATERPGSMRIVEKDGRMSAALGGVPAVYASGQGGL